MSFDLSNVNNNHPRNKHWLTELQGVELGVEAFVQLVNELLPRVLPDESSSQKMREDVNVRLLRHYTSLGMLDEPRKEGKEARYGYRHLLQFLLVRRMQSESYSSLAIADLPRRRTDAELLRLLSGELQVTAAPEVAPLQKGDSENDALSYLAGLRKREQKPAPASGSSAALASEWKRYTLRPGLEVQLSRQFHCPTGNSLEQLLDEVRSALLHGFNGSHPK